MSNIVDIEALRFPIGDFQYVEEGSKKKRLERISNIDQLTTVLRDLIQGVKPEQMLNPYRPGSWQASQVIHHLADSHMNSYIRFKLALTEPDPVIKPYDEAAWAEFEDGQMIDVEASLLILEGLHRRWTIMLSNMSDEDFQKSFYHPESNDKMSLEKALALYSWHSLHHTAHVRNAINLK